jgi:hypothetical protein
LRAGGRGVGEKLPDVNPSREGKIC